MASSRSSSPTGRVSPFRGRGFNPLGSRHATPSPSPTPPPAGPKTVQKIKSSISQIPVRRRSSEEEELYYQISSKKYNQRQRQPALTSGYSKSMTNISSRNLLGKPSSTPSKRSVINSRYSYLRLSPIVGSSPEPGSDQNPSSPSRIPRSKSQPPSRLVSPNGSRVASRNVSRSSSPTSRSPTKIPKKSSSYRNIPSKIDNRISSAKPKGLPKKPLASRNRTGSKRNLNKLEEQSSADVEDEEEEEEDWNDDYSKARSRREIPRTKSRSKFDLSKSDKKPSKSKNSSDSSAKEDRDSGRTHKTSVREKSTQTKKRSSAISDIKDEIKDDDILSVTIDATGMPPTTEIISNTAAVMGQPIHVETKLIKSRESLASIQSALSDIGSCRKESTASYDSHGKRFEHQDSVASMVSHTRVPGSTTHTAKQNSQGSGSGGQVSKQSSQGSAGSKPSNAQGSTTHTAKQSVGQGSAKHSSAGSAKHSSGPGSAKNSAGPGSAKQSAAQSAAKQSFAAIGRMSAAARHSNARQSTVNRSPEGSVPPSAKTSPRSSATSKRSIHSSATHTAKSIANSPGGASTISSSSSTTSARSVISNRNFRKISHSIATVSSIGRNLRSNQSPNRSPSAASRRPSQSPGSAVGSRSPNPGSATRRISKLGENPLKRVSKTVTSLDKLHSGFGKMPPPDSDTPKISNVTNPTLMDPSILVSDPSEKAKQSRTVIVDEIQPIKITVKEKGADVEVQSGNVSLPRSATNGISQRPV